MGYGHAIWLVYNQEIFETEHIGHFTVACFLNETSALDLLNDIKEKIGKDTVNIHLEGKPQIYDPNYYSLDKTGLYAWGYDGKSDLWNNLKSVCSAYDCCFSDTPHTSICYDICLETLRPLSTTNKLISCKLYMADTTSDNPKYWRITGN